MDKKILETLDKIASNTRSRPLISLRNGVLSGFGSVIGVLIALTLLGWILNIAGLVPFPFIRTQVDHWQSWVSNWESKTK
jgi:hypothetical protein